MSNDKKKPTAYTFTLAFPASINEAEVTEVGYQVTGEPPLNPPLPANKMPDKFEVNDTITFTYAAANPDVTIKSSLFTRYSTKESTKEQDDNFLNKFDQPITFTEKMKGNWIFHLLGLYKSNDGKAAYYLDPEATVS